MIEPIKTILPDPDAQAAQDPDAPMTDRQAATLRDLTARTGDPFDGNLTQAQAQERIEALQEQTEKES